MNAFRKAIPSLLLQIALITSALAQETATPATPTPPAAAAPTLPEAAAEGEGTQKSGIGSAKTGYTCDQVDGIKFDRAAYVALKPTDRMIIDAQFQQCEAIKKQSSVPTEEDSSVILFTNPAPTSEDDKLFYGLVKRKDLDKAEAACATAGGAGGIAISFIGAGTGLDVAGKLGSAVYNYSGVSCQGLKNSFAEGNMLALLAPQAIVVAAVQTKIATDLLKAIPLVSNADKTNLTKALSKALAPPSVSISGSHVVVATGPVKISVKKPRVKIGKVKIKF